MAHHTGTPLCHPSTHLLGPPIDRGPPTTLPRAGVGVAESWKKSFCSCSGGKEQKREKKEQEAEEEEGGARRDLGPL